MRTERLIILIVFALFSAYSYMLLRKLFSWNSQSKVVPFVANMATGPGNKDWKSAKSIYDFSAIDIDGVDVSLEKYRGHVTLIVNVASKWGLTPSNYAQLQALYEKYSESKGLRILGFPCNQFGGQEPGSEAEIKEFVKQYNVQFDMFSKIDVNGNNTHPLWSYLKNKLGGLMGSFIKWNFTKFLVDKNGQPVKRYGPQEAPKDIEPELLKYFEA